MSEDPIAENAAFAILTALKGIPPSAMREDQLYSNIVCRDGWEAADVTNGLKYAETQGWIKRAYGRASATQKGIEALRRSEK
jgi:hypothetical protein